MDTCDRFSHECIGAIYCHCNAFQRDVCLDILLLCFGLDGSAQLGTSTRIVWATAGLATLPCCLAAGNRRCGARHQFLAGP